MLPFPVKNYPFEIFTRASPGSSLVKEYFQSFKMRKAIFLFQIDNDMKSASVKKTMTPLFLVSPQGSLRCQGDYPKEKENPTVHLLGLSGSASVVSCILGYS